MENGNLIVEMAKYIVEVKENAAGNVGDDDELYYFGKSIRDGVLTMENCEELRDDLLELILEHGYDVSGDEIVTLGKEKPVLGRCETCGEVNEYEARDGLEYRGYGDWDFSDVRCTSCLEFTVNRVLE